MPESRRGAEQNAKRSARQDQTERRREEALGDLSKRAERAVVKDKMAERRSGADVEEAIEEMEPPPELEEQANGETGVSRRDAPGQ